MTFFGFEVLSDAAAVRNRNAGKTSNLVKRSQDQREKLIHEAVEFISFGDVKSEWILCLFLLHIYVSLNEKYL